MAVLLGNPIPVLFLGLFLFLSACGTKASFASSEHPEEPPILRAIIDNNVGEAAELLAKGVNVNARIEKAHVAYQGKTLMGIAVMEQNPEMVRLFLDKGADVNAASRFPMGPVRWNERTPIHIAAEYPNVEIAEMLILRGADMEARDRSHTTIRQLIPISPFGDTPLYIAVRNKNKKVAELLLNRGANVNAKRFDDSIPLHAAISSGDREMIELLIAHGADAKAPGIFDAAVAGGRGRIGIVKLVCEHGATVSNPTKLLQDAVDSKNVELIEFLLDRGAQIKARDPRVMIGKTPLERSVMEGNTDIAKLLAVKGATDNLSKEEATRLLFAAVEGKNVSFAALAVDKGADLNARMNFLSLLNYHTPLQIGCMSAGAKGEFPVRGYEIVKFLIEKGADINIQDNKGNTLMHYSVLPDDINPLVIELLLTIGLEVNSRNRDGETPLHTVSTMEGVKLLINKGADINAKDEKGRTPLALAIQKNDLNKAYVLKENGAKE